MKFLMSVFFLVSFSGASFALNQLKLPLMHKQSSFYYFPSLEASVGERDKSSYLKSKISDSYTPKRSIGIIGIPATPEVFTELGNNGEGRNILLVSKSGTEQKYLFKNSVKLRNFFFIKNEDQKKYPVIAKNIYSEVSMEDTNKDGSVDENDRIELYVAKLDGSQLKSLVPTAYSLDEMAFDFDKNQIVMVFKGLNGKKQFGDDSPRTAAIYDIGKDHLQVF